MSSVSAATISEVIDRFVKEVSLGNSVDWFLIKLSSAIDELETLAKFSRASVREYIAIFLQDERVKKQLSRISCYIEEVQRNISSSPRFRSLRPYLSDIIEVLRHIPCSEAFAEKQLRTRTQRDFVYEMREFGIPVRKVSKRTSVFIHQKSFRRYGTKTRLGASYLLERLATYTLYAIAVMAAILFILQLV